MTHPPPESKQGGASPGRRVRALHWHAHGPESDPERFVIASNVDHFIATCMTVGWLTRAEWHAPATLAGVMAASSLAGRGAPPELAGRVDRACAYLAATGQASGSEVCRAFTDPLARQTAVRLAYMISGMTFRPAARLKDVVDAVGACITSEVDIDLTRVIVEVDTSLAPPGYEVACPAQVSRLDVFFVRDRESRLFVLRSDFDEILFPSEINPSVDEAAAAWVLRRPPWAGGMFRRIADASGTPGCGVADLRDAFEYRGGEEGLRAWAFLDAVARTITPVEASVLSAARRRRI